MLLEFDELKFLSNKHKGQSIVLTEGCFDLLHIGHVAFLEKCKALGDLLVVAVPSDKVVQEKKGWGRPIIPAYQRAFMLSALSAVDYSTISPDAKASDEISTALTVAALKPNVFVTSKKRYHDHLLLFRDSDLQLTMLQEIRLTSTTSIIEKIRTLSAQTNQ